MKEEARGAALLEMLPLRDYVAATLGDPARAQTFRRHVALVRKSWWVGGWVGERPAASDDLFDTD